MIQEGITVKQKMLIFHPALAPYRVDQFNLLHELYDLEVVFLFDRLWNFNIDQESLEKECRFKISFLLKGPRYKGRLFRWGMYRKIKQVNPDIVMGYEYSFTTQYLILLKSSGLVKQKIGAFIDDSPEICRHVQSRLRGYARNYAIKRLDFLVVMSEEVAGFYRERFKLSKNQVIVSPILQLPERLRKEKEQIESLANNYVSQYQLEGKRGVLFVGRFIPEKALSLFISTVAPLLTQHNDVVLILIGEGEEKAQLSAIVEEKNLKDKVIFPGKYQAESLYGWYACASGFVLPSLSETFGAVVNEALIFGLTVLCSSYAGASCLINSQNGLLFNPADKEDTLRRFQQYIDNLSPLADVCLDSKPSLIENHRMSFMKEWGKI